ncbi:hypothetical protein WJX72_005592 [[Myrmecia] bisecta]|uniref:Kinesin-like protein n=1 Tax=[Myrmecia] bisecta TaxID=41462 RepID=A0AAW1Q7S9_9CHLO
MVSSTCKVVVRLKPKRDPTDDAVQCIENIENPTLLIKKGIDEDGLYQFNFTRVLNQAQQAELHEVCGRDIVSSVLEGYNGTIMAYGQTGSGKTYTMTGPEDADLDDPEMQGIMPRAIGQIFRELKRKRIPQWKVGVSYVEIYNEGFRDLLGPETKSSDIGISENKKGTISLKNIICPKCENAKDALNVLKQGQMSRHVAGHGLNTRSSRSHTIFTLWVETVDAEGAAFASKLNLVDLAGSERYTKTGAEGSTAKEAMHINKSLTFLEQVIIALSKKKQQHVPYRSSKLTHFLKDSIGGNCQTLLIACVWSDEDQLSETLSTCRFAQRMMQVTVDAQKNKGGLSSVHGNLFKLDPVMQQYLEQMTAAAVAREKARLVAEFHRHGGLLGGELEEEELEAEEGLELAELRRKVTELEALQEQVQQNHGKTLVDEETLAEMEELRMRVMELENSRPLPAPESDELLAEMEELRSRVMELQDMAELSETDVAELAALRMRVTEVAELQAAAETHISEDEVAELSQLKELRDRVVELQLKEAHTDTELEELEGLRAAVLSLQATQFVEGEGEEDAGDIYKAEEEDRRRDEEAEALRQKIRELEALQQEQAGAAPPLPPPVSQPLQDDSEKEALMQRIRELEEALPQPAGRPTQVVPDGEEGDVEREALMERIRQLEEEAACLPPESGAAISSPAAPRPEDEEERERLRQRILQLEEAGSRQPPEDDSQAAEQELRLQERLRQLEAAEMRVKELEAQSAGQAATQSVSVDTHMDAYAQSFSSNGSTDLYGFNIDKDWDKKAKKGGWFGRLLGKGKRRGEHESFSSFAPVAPPDQLDDDSAPNIVILNSLTHDQLLELLKAHNMSSESGNHCRSTDPATDEQLAGFNTYNGIDAVEIGALVEA